MVHEMTTPDPTPVGPAKWKPCPICGKVLLRGANGSRYHPSGRKCPLADLYMSDRQRRSWNNRDHIGEANKMAAPSHFPTEAEGALIRIREIMAGEGCSAEAVMQMEAILIALPAALEAGEVERLRAMLSASDDRLRETEMRLTDATNAYRMTRVERDAARDRVEAAVARIAELEADRHKLAYAICGGEDFPGLLDATPVEALVKIARDTASAALSQPAQGGEGGAV